MELRTARLVLRDFVAEDLEAYRALRSAPGFGQHYPEDDVTPERSRELLARFLAEQRAEPRLRYQLAVTLSSTGELIGSCGVRLVDVDAREASFGCELGLEHWGKGYALEAGRAVLGFGFEELAVARVYAETQVVHLAARRLAERLGFVVEEERDGAVVLSRGP